jgi:hypothetical protein
MISTIRRSLGLHHSCCCDESERRARGGTDGWRADAGASAGASVERVNVSVLISRESAAQAVEAIGQQRAGVLPIFDASLQQRRSQGVSIATVVVASGRPASRFDALLSGSYAAAESAAFVGAEEREGRGRGGARQLQRRGADGVGGCGARTTLRICATCVAWTCWIPISREPRRCSIWANNQLLAGVATQIDVTRAEAQLAIAEQGRLQQATGAVSERAVVETPARSRPRRADETRGTSRCGGAGSDLFVFSDQQSAFAQTGRLLGGPAHAGAGENRRALREL